MNKRIFTFLFSVMLSASAFAQQKNFTREQSTELTRILSDVSNNSVILPDSIHLILKSLALKRKLSDAFLAKHEYVLKSLYNISLSKPDRLLAYEFLHSQASGPDYFLPLYIIEGTKSFIENSAK